MSHLDDRPQRLNAQDDVVGTSKGSNSSYNGNRRPYQQQELGSRGGGNSWSQHHVPRSNIYQDDDNTTDSHKSRESRWKEQAEPSDNWAKRRDVSTSLKTRDEDSFVDTRLAPLVIRGAASKKASFSEEQRPISHQPPHSDRRRSTSPNLFDRITPHKAKSEADRNNRREYGESRSAKRDSYAKRDTRTSHDTWSKSDRIDNSSNSRPPPSAPSPKLTPRGRYDDNGRRIDSGSSQTSEKWNHSRRDKSYAEIVDSDRLNIPTSPRRQNESRSERDSLFSRDNARSSQDSKQFIDQRRSRTRDRSASPTSRFTRNSRATSPAAFTKRQRHEIDNNTNSRFAPVLTQPRQWGATQGANEHQSWAESDHESKKEIDRRKRRRSSSPARSDTSKSQWRATLTSENRDRGQNRPTRWKTDPSREAERGWTRDRGEADRRRLHREDHDRKHHEQRRNDSSRSSDTNSGHLLARKSEANDDRHLPSHSFSNRSVRGEGWQTVRHSIRPVENCGQMQDDQMICNEAQESSGPAGTGADTKAVSIPRAGPGEAYVSINQVGEGTYGQVFKARSEQTGVLVALKKIRMESEKEGFPITAMREIKLLQALRHENVVRLHEMMVTRGSIYMVFEYMEHDLNGILAHHEINFSEGHRKSLALQLLTGLEYLHKKAVLHRDLKGSNILLNNEGRLKLADFGLARFYAKRRTGDYTNRVVTLWYRPPELLFGETQYGPEVDMWGAGCLFLELFVRKPVFQSESELQQVQVIANILGPMTPAVWPGVDRLAWYEMVKPGIKTHEVAPAADAVSGEIQDRGRDYLSISFRKCMPTSALEVARGLLTYDPNKRWSATEAIRSTYFSTEPEPELPARVLSELDGEWHEYESRKARKKANAPNRKASNTMFSGVVESPS